MSMFVSYARSIVLSVLWVFCLWWFTFAHLYFESADMSQLPDCYGPSAGDVDGNGYPDTYCIPYSRWYGWLSTNSLLSGKPIFSARNIGYGWGYNMATQMFDLEWDGDIDIFVGGSYVKYVMLNDGQGEFLNLWFLPMGNNRGSERAQGQAIGDFNGDGIKDFYLSSNGGVDRIVLSTGSTDFGSTNWETIRWYTYTTLTTKWWYPIAGDIDGDGDVDIYVPLVNGDSSSKLLINDGHGNFSSVYLAWDRLYTDRTTVLMQDFDGDGKLDLLIGTNMAWVPVVLYLNKGDLNFERKELDIYVAGRYIIADDIDNDGDIDLYVNRTGTVNALYLNDWSANFTHTIIDGTVWSSLDQGASYGSVIADFDKNGMVDIWVPWRHLWLQKFPVKIVLDAPTLQSSGVIADTTIHVFGSGGIDPQKIVLDPSTVVAVEDFHCESISEVEAQCSLKIKNTDQGDILKLTVTDNAGTVASMTKAGYMIDSIPPQLPDVVLETTDPYSSHAPLLSFTTVDHGVWLDYCTLQYREDNNASGVHTDTTLVAPATSPISLSLDPDELVHEVIVRCYDKVGNMSANIVKFPPIVQFDVPTPISSGEITDMVVTITSPLGNPISNITIVSSSGETPSLDCEGADQGQWDPYQSPVRCRVGALTKSGIITVEAVDQWTLAHGKNSTHIVIEQEAPRIIIDAPHHVASTSITTTVLVYDDTAIDPASVQVDVTNTTATVGDLSCVAVNPKQVSCTIPIIDDGDLVIVAQDRAGNSASAEDSWYIIDTVSPSILLSGIISQDAVTETIVSASADDDHKLDMTSFMYGFSADSSCTEDDLYDVAYQIGEDIVFDDATYNGQWLCFSVRDHVGNTTYMGFEHPLRIDVQEPTISIVSPLSGAVITSTSTGVVFESHDDQWPLSHQCQINTGARFACQSPYTLVWLSDGEYIFTVEVTDGVGKKAKAQTQFRVQIPKSSWGWGGYSITQPLPSSPPSSQLESQLPTDLYNPTIGKSCYSPNSYHTIDQGILVSDLFKTAHQMFYNFELTKWQWTKDFRPYDMLTRQEAARFMVKFAENVLCRKRTRIYDAHFTDLGNADPSLIPFIRASYEYQIFNGDYKNEQSLRHTTFRPTDRITQDELTAILVRLLTHTLAEEPRSVQWAQPYHAQLGVFMKNSTLFSMKRENIAEVMYDVYRNNTYTYQSVGYVIQ